jgi:flagellar assembly factor FliW
MKIQTTRFGEVEVPEKEVYAFPDGLLGFADIRSFVLLQNPRGGPFHWLQATETPSLAFVVTDPTLFFKDYRVGIRKEDMEVVGLEDIGKGVVLVILTLSKDIRDVTANLQGPVILSRETRRGKQIVLADPAYTTRHRLFPDRPAAAEPKADGAAAGKDGGEEKEKEKP